MGFSVLSIAPMMGYTNRYFRSLLRLVCPPALLYTEMISAAALVRREPEYVARLLDFSPIEHPVVLQLGGSNSIELAQAARMVEEWGYDGVNLNVGCPSERVQAGHFGACLMKDPDLVAECVRRMQEVVSIPVTIKTRIGVDHDDSYEHLTHFVKTVAEAGCDTFIVHARKAWLNGLNPRQNRAIPPLRYEVVHQLKKDFKALKIVINGGLTTSAAICEQLNHVDGVMIGRSAYQDLAWMQELGNLYGDKDRSFSRMDIIEAYLPIMEQGLKDGVPLVKLAGGLVGLCKGLPGARFFRQRLFDPRNGVKEALAIVSNFLENESV